VEKESAKVKEEKAAELRNLNDKFHEEQRKCEKLEELVQQLKNAASAQSI